MLKAGLGNSFLENQLNSDIKITSATMLEKKGRAKEDRATEQLNQVTDTRLRRSTMRFEIIAPKAKDSAKATRGSFCDMSTKRR